MVLYKTTIFPVFHIFMWFLVVLKMWIFEKICDFSVRRGLVDDHGRVRYLLVFSRLVHVNFDIFTIFSSICFFYLVYLLKLGRKPDTATASVPNSWNYGSLKLCEFLRFIWNRVFSVDIENFDLFSKFEKNRDFWWIFRISDIREFFAKRKI